MNSVEVTENPLRIGGDNCLPTMFGPCSHTIACPARCVLLRYRKVVEQDLLDRLVNQLRLSYTEEEGRNTIPAFEYSIRGVVTLALTVHFLNVGHGDCTIIEFHKSGRISWIDINNSKALPDDDMSSLTVSEAKRFEDLLVDPLEYWKNRFTGESIFRFIATHPDMDHLSGLYRLVHQEKVPILNFWDINHQKKFTEEDFKNSPYDYRDWQTYQELRAGKHSNKVLNLHRGDRGQYWVDDGIAILSPTLDLERRAKEKDDYNIASYVLWVQCGDFVLVLGGDADNENAWPDIMDYVDDDILSKVTILKASHHGRKTGYYQPIVRAMSPRYTIVSVGKKPDNDASQLYAQYSEVISTRYYGTIIAHCYEDGSVKLYDAYGNKIGR